MRRYEYNENTCNGWKSYPVRLTLERLSRCCSQPVARLRMTKKIFRDIGPIFTHFGVSEMWDNDKGVSVELKQRDLIELLPSPVPNNLAVMYKGLESILELLQCRKKDTLDCSPVVYSFDPAEYFHSEDLESARWQYALCELIQELHDKARNVEYIDWITIILPGNRTMV
jgi:hypothetical protein